MSSAPPPAAGTTDPAAVSERALARYERRLRPYRIAYAAGLLVAALVLAAVVKIAYSHGEISHATLHPARAVPPAVTLTSPSATLTRAWSSSDHTAIGVPYASGTIITYDQHAVRGRDARTGQVTWSYTRTDRTLCTAIQDQGVTIAVYELHGNCDELDAFDSEKGTRSWTRTLDKDGAELNGHPRYTVIPYTVMLTTPGAIYAIDPSSGLDRWVFQQDGCAVRSAVLGVSGALISERCSGRECTDQKFCGNGLQLLLRDGSTRENTDTTTNNGNPDQITWNLIGSDLVPASAGKVISALTPDGGTLRELSAKRGATLGSARIAAPSLALTGTSAAADADLVRIGATTYVLSGATSRFTWTARTAAVPSVTGKSGAGTPSLGAALLAVPATRALELLDPATGSVQRSFPVATPPPGSSVYPFGSGFLVAGPRTTLYR